MSADGGSLELDQLASRPASGTSDRKGRPRSRTAAVGDARLEPPTRWLEREYDRAVGARSESGWEQFASIDRRRAGELPGSEVEWLISRVLDGRGLPHARALAIVSVASAVAEAQPARGPELAWALRTLLAHPVDEVVAAALETIADIDIETAKQLAASIVSRAQDGVLSQTLHAIQALSR